MQDKRARQQSLNGKGRRGEEATEVLRALGKKMKLRRIEQGFTLQNVADRTGVSAAMLSLVRSLVGVIHRVLVDDQPRGLQMTLNHYSSGSANSPQPIRHHGYEYGFVLDGELEVTVDDNKHLLRSGDVISYWSTQPHRIVNRRKKKARAIWINLRTS
jgi:quercetin dioxygenase-like cupin family protein